MPTGVTSFDRTNIKTIGGYTYTATKFDIWKDYGSKKLAVLGADTSGYVSGYMYGHSVIVHQLSEWKNVSGNLSVNLQKPNDSAIGFNLLVK